MSSRSRLRPAKPRLGPDAVAPEHQHDDECQQIHQSIPANRERPEMDGYRIELRMDEHGGAGEVGELYVSDLQLREQRIHCKRRHGKTRKEIAKLCSMCNAGYRHRMHD